MDKENAQLLAWYVNGSLAGADRDRIEDALEGDADAPALLGWERAIRSAVKTDSRFDIAADRGLSEVLQKIRHEAPGSAKGPAPKKSSSYATPVTSAAMPAGSGWLSRMRTLFNSSPALAMAFSLVVVQFGVIAHLLPSTKAGEEGSYSGVRAVEGRTTPDAFIRIAFKPESTEAQISALLRSNHAEIVAGPSQLGDYYLVLGRGDAPDALNQLQIDPHVESAEIVNVLPARN